MPFSAASFGRYEDQCRYHIDSIDHLQAELARLQNRLKAMYVDKLDGRVSGAFFDEKVRRVALRATIAPPGG